MSIHRFIIGIEVALVVILSCAVYGQNMPVNKDLAHGNGMVPNDKPVKDYKPTEVQLLRLQVQQKDAQLLQAQLQSIQRQFNEKVSELMSSAQKVKLENGWPPETQFSPDTLVFSAPPPKEDKKQ
jgi:hypothetical protein